MSEPSLPEKVVAIDDCLREAKIAHAFGGALALASYAEPRATIDVDVNVFLEAARHPDVLAALATLGVVGDAPLERVERDEQCRVFWGATPIDLFYAYHELHSAMRKGTRQAPFGERTVPILAPEHLITCKAIFNRPKDWLDIEQILVGTLDTDSSEVTSWLDRIVGPDDPRAHRFAELGRRFEGTV
ncbi:MAG TPA: hypothetical protein VEX36_04665 [Thermoleophilaceae bacterium]|nr:hypothetical protein [Thermoleophilaceae bacterium]